MNKLILLSFIFMGCHFFKEEPIYYNQVNVNTVPSDFKVPKKIFSEISGQEESSEKSLKPVYIFVPLSVALSADIEVMPKSPLKVNFPNGGGKIDLKEYLSGTGSFYMNFPKDQFKNLPELTHLFFISDSPKKNIDHEDFGLGCGFFVDLKNKFNALQDPHFLKFNTTDMRYFHVAVGYYIFVFQEKNTIYLTHLNVIDSRHSENMCSTISVN